MYRQPLKSVAKKCLVEILEVKTKITAQEIVDIVREVRRRN